jgi:hypothetical protein
VLRIEPVIITLANTADLNLDKAFIVIVKYY